MTAQWTEIYSQTMATHRFRDCVLGDCNRFANAENYLNFDLLCPNEAEYKFKFVWNNGVISPHETSPNDQDYAMEWTQSLNPLSATDTDMNPTGAVLIPSGNTPPLFKGLSFSSGPDWVLLDGNVGGWRWYYVGYKRNHHGGNGIGAAAYIYPDIGGGKVASRVQLFVAGCVDECVGGTHTCDPLATCTNTAEGFTCECPTGFTGDGSTCSIPTCDVWQKAPQNSSHGVIPTLDKTWHLEMNIRPNDIGAGFTNLFHATIGGNQGAYGDRVPAIWFIGGSTKLTIGSAVNGNGNYWFHTEPLEMHEWSKVEVRQDFIDGQYIFQIWVNDIEVHSVENTRAQVFNNVEVFAGDPWYGEPPADICNSWFHTPSGSIQLGVGAYTDEPTLPELMKMHKWQESIPVLFQPGGECGVDAGHIMTGWMRIPDLESVEDLTHEGYRTAMCMPVIMGRRRRDVGYVQSASGGEGNSRRRRHTDDHIREYVPFDVGFSCDNWEADGSCPLDQYMIQFCCHPIGWVSGVTTTTTTTTGNPNISKTAYAIKKSSREFVEGFFAVILQK